MTKHELYSLRSIEREIKLYNEKIAELRELAESISPNYSGMPPSGGVSDKIGNAVAGIVTYEKLLEKALQERIEQCIKINQYILDVNDADVRNIMYLRFIKQKTWIAIALHMGGGNTADGVRKRCMRWIDSHS